MKVKIKTFNGELPSYLTDGKVYEVVESESNGTGFYIVDDDNDEDSMSYILIDGCGNLNGGSWEVVE